MGKNGYLQKRKQTINTYRQAEKDTYIQYMVDIFMIVLNDPAVMGKDVFGKKRIMRVVEAVSKTFDNYALALTDQDEADYLQEKLDQRLASILGDDDLIPFSKRYGWIEQKGYSKKGK